MFFGAAAFPLVGNAVRALAYLALLLAGGTIGGLQILAKALVVAQHPTRTHAELHIIAILQAYPAGVLRLRRLCLVDLQQL